MTDLTIIESGRISLQGQCQEILARGFSQIIVEPLNMVPYSLQFAKLFATHFFALPTGINDTSNNGKKFKTEGFFTVLRIRILLSPSKNSKKNLDSYFFVTSI
jgi:hypothetical protein